MRARSRTRRDRRGDGTSGRCDGANGDRRDARRSAQRPEDAAQSPHPSPSRRRQRAPRSKCPVTYTAAVTPATGSIPAPTATRDLVDSRLDAQRPPTRASCRSPTPAPRPDSTGSGPSAPDATRSALALATRSPISQSCRRRPRDHGAYVIERRTMRSMYQSLPVWTRMMPATTGPGEHDEAVDGDGRPTAEKALATFGRPGHELVPALVPRRSVTPVRPCHSWFAEGSDVRATAARSRRGLAPSTGRAGDVHQAVTDGSAGPTRHGEDRSTRERGSRSSTIHVKRVQTHSRVAWRSRHRRYPLATRFPVVLTGGSTVMEISHRSVVVVLTVRSISDVTVMRHTFGQAHGLIRARSSASCSGIR